MLYNSILWGTGLRPVAVCRDPPTTLHSDLEKCFFNRAECAVIKLTCVSETDTEYRFSPTLVNTAFSRFLVCQKSIRQKRASNSLQGLFL